MTDHNPVSFTQLERLFKKGHYVNRSRLSRTIFWYPAVVGRFQVSCKAEFHRMFCNQFRDLSKVWYLISGNGSALLLNIAYTFRFITSLARVNGPSTVLAMIRDTNTVNWLTRFFRKYPIHRWGLAVRKTLSRKFSPFFQRFSPTDHVVLYFRR